MTTADLAFIAPELWLAAASIILLMVGVSAGRDRTGLMSGAAALVLVVAMVLTVAVVPRSGGGFDGAFSGDLFSVVGRVMIYLGAMVAALLAVVYLEQEKLARFEYPLLILLASIGMGVMVSAQDLIGVYMGIELQSLSLYILATFNRESRRSTEAGLKYFVLGALSSGFLLYGASLVYGFSGSIRFEEIATAVAASDNQLGLVFGLVFLLAGVGFKVSAAPFHMWTPDVYEGAPTPVTAFFAAAPKVAGMFLFSRLLVEAFGGIADQWQPIVWFLAAASMIVGSVSALLQTNIKRLMAYSSISHVGYALMGLAAGNIAGISGVILYLGIYLIMTLGIFACILSMRRAEGMTESISDLSGLMQSQPGLGLSITALMLSLAGIPFFLGFFGKFAVFLAAVEAELYILLIIGVLTSVISSFYYLSVIKTVWMGARLHPFDGQRGPVVAATASLCAIAVTIGFLAFVGPLTRLADAAAASLF